MNLVTIAIACGLLAQVAEQPDRYRPQVKSKAPPVKLDNGPADTGFNAPPRQFDNDRPLGNANDAPPQDNGAGAQLTPVEGGPRPRLRPPELLAEALEKPQEGALVGTPILLQMAIARSGDRQQQLKITQAYWRLSTAQADYHWVLDQRNRLAHHTREHTNTPAVLSARATARADVHDMQLAVAEAQEDLISAIGGPAEASPPLTVDRPHVGDYHTYYEAIFGNSAPPPRIRLIHRTLPVLRQAIDAHGEAIVAALDALEATGDHFEKTGQGLTAVLAAIDLLKQERRRFMADVRDYNQDIAEYAIATAPPGTDGKALVARLILTPRAGDAQRGGTRPSDAGGPETQRPPEGEPPQQEEAPQTQQQTSHYQHKGADEPGTYQALLAIADEPQRVQRLANLLHWDRNLPGDVGAGATLSECLSGVAPEQRLSVITAYWQTRERAARYQALNEQVEQLNILPPIAVNLLDQPGMTEAGVRLQAARRGAHAAVLDAHVELFEAQFDLTQAAGRRLDDPWLLPTTAPQSGRYVVAPGAARGNAAARRWANAIRVGHAMLEQRTDAILQADVLRASLVNETRRGADIKAEAGDEPMRLDSTLWSIVRENRETLTFLSDLTAYNIAIANYALATLPAGISSDELVKKLVVPRSTRRDT